LKGRSDYPESSPWRSPMLLQDRILALLAQYPGASGADIRAALSDAKRVSIASAINRLRDKGQIETAGWGAYRLSASVVPKENRTAVPAAAPLARLMAGR
jgi:hypothetical protein